jgi:hypothetical protein
MEYHKIVSAIIVSVLTNDEIEMLVNGDGCDGGSRGDDNT